MKKILVLLFVLVAIAACAAPPTNTPTPSTSTNRAADSTAVAPTEAEATAREKSTWDALKRKDYDAFANMLATDYLEVHSEGTYDKTGIVNYVKDLEFTEVNFSDWRMVPIDKDAVLLLYNVTLKGKFKGEDIPAGPYRASSIWVNRSGKWQAIYYQETLSTPAMPAPAGTPAPTASASPATKAAETAAPADPIAREKMIWDTLRRRDYDAFASHLDAAQVEVESDGVYDKAGTLKGVRTFDASKAELSDFKAVTLNADAQLVNYRVTVPGAKPEKSWNTTLWVNRAGKWVALFHQGTPSETAASPAASPAK